MHVLLVSLLFGIVSGLVAHNRARNALGWFIAGCIIGPFALLVALLPVALKPGVTRQCPACSETIREDALLCRYCRSDLRPHKSANKEARNGDTYCVT
jgi:hypothetical protein